MAGAGNDYFDRLHRRLLDEGRSPVEARLAVFDAYLDGKPQAAGRLKPTRADRDRWFWSSALVGECGPGDWGSEAGGLLAAQIELNEFMSRSVDAHCFDDSVRFVPVDDRRLDLVEMDPEAKAKWARDGKKLERLPGYWLHRAFHEFAASDMAHAPIGQPENKDENRLAYIRAIATRLRLREAYGVADAVTAPTGEAADMFQALLSLELTARFFMVYFIVPFVEGTEQTGDWIVSLRRLAMGGLVNGMQYRFPLTWANRAEK